MKKILLLLAVTACLVGCKEENRWGTDQCVRATEFKACTARIPQDMNRPDNFAKAIEECSDAARLVSLRRAETVSKACIGPSTNFY